jgi:hypothetical protein
MDTVAALEQMTDAESRVILLTGCLTTAAPRAATARLQAQLDDLNVRGPKAVLRLYAKSVADVALDTNAAQQSLDASRDSVFRMKLL